MTFEKFYFITKLCEKYDEGVEFPTYEDMYVTARVCWEEFSESKYYQFQINKEGIGPAVEEYITENLFQQPTFIYQRIKTAYPSASERRVGRLPNSTPGLWRK